MFMCMLIKNETRRDETSGVCFALGRKGKEEIVNR